jgi:hypothetical protein
MANSSHAPSSHRLLGIYLNDHLAGATGGTALAHRIAGALKDGPDGPAVTAIAGEISADRDALISIMRRLDVPIRREKAAAAWLAERAGRLKLNGRLLARSPLSTVLELELMRLGVSGKRAGWRTLRELSVSEPRLDPGQLDELMERADRQAENLEQLRLRAAAAAFGYSG